MRLRGKYVKWAVTAGVLTSVLQFGSCNVSPELLNSIVSAVVNQVEQSGALQDLQNQLGDLHQNNPAFGADGPAAGHDANNQQ